MNDKILLGHGSGGKMTGKLIKDCFIKHFGNPVLNVQSDSAILDIKGNLLSYTTDSYVIDPVFFPGGNIGKLAACGTLNDLAVSGAKPLYLSAAFIIEEGFSLADLDKIAASMAEEVDKNNVKIVTGDTKVVGRGQCDKIFINTSGIGLLNSTYRSISTGEDIQTGDAILVNGDIGDHGIAILGARENIRFEHEILSDCSSLSNLIQDILSNNVKVKFMRDLTRGGLASVLCEISEHKLFGIQINESEIPVKEAVKGTCEIFGFDPLYLANEGKIVMIVDRNDANKALNLMKKHTEGSAASIIGEIIPDHQGKTIINSVTGGKRLIDKLAGEQLPRIC